ncbi:MAG: hypothetical protein WDM78_20995 [Puia sp.]
MLFSGAWLSIRGDDYAFSSATSDAQGVIHFGFRDIYKNNAIVVQPALQKDSFNRIDINNSYSDKVLFQYVAAHDAFQITGIFIGKQEYQHPG